MYTENQVSGKNAVNREGQELLSTIIGTWMEFEVNQDEYLNGRERQ